MDYFPIFMNVRGQTCLVVGGGAVARRKTEALLRSGASIRLVAPEISVDLQTLVIEKQGELLSRNFQPTDLDGVVLVIAATDDERVNQQVSALAAQARLPVNVVDQPDLSTFITPAVVDRSPVVVAVSSGGKAPVLTRLLKARIESFVPSAWGRLAQLVGGYRNRVKQKLPTLQQRNRFWSDVLQGPVAELALAGQVDQSEALLQKRIEDPSVFSTGAVYLVGAGPGDPDLLTFRALRLLQQADLVVYDRLVSPQIIELIRKDAEKIYVGKQRSEHSVPQPQINQLLLEQAQAGKIVVRLKGGDPFIFGRGGEEIATLAAEKIPFQVVPGITAASGCAAYSGIPLTHRDHTQMVVFVTGHLKDNSVNLDWQPLAHLDATLVIYMGLIGLPVICRELIAHGKDPQTPIALIESGTLASQRVFTGTLATLSAELDQYHVRAPTLIIIGQVVGLKDQLEWFQSRAEQQSGGSAES